MAALIKIKVGILIIGGGIVGALGADYFSELEYGVLLLRVNDKGFPRADTLTNHGWWHTGPWYWLKWTEAPHLLTALRYWGREMLDRYNILPGSGPAIFSTTDPQRALMFQEKAHQFAYNLKTCDVNEAQSQLGLQCLPESYNFGVLDRPFSPATVIRMARNNARRNGADLRDLPVRDKVRLVRDPSSANGFVVRAGQYVIEADLTILAAGAAIPELLESLGVPHHITVSRSVLITTASQGLWETTISGNMDSGITIVRHDSERSPTGSYEVIGGKGRVPIEGDIWSQRVPELREVENLLEQLPAPLREAVEQAGYEATAGLKTEAMDDRGVSNAVPYVEVVNHDGIRNLCIALPGKATFGLYTVHKIAQECGLARGDYSLEGKDGGSDPEGGPSDTPPGEKWMAMPQMHWDYSKESTVDEFAGTGDETDNMVRKEGKTNE